MSMLKGYWFELNCTVKCIFQSWWNMIWSYSVYTREQNPIDDHSNIWGYSWYREHFNLHIFHGRKEGNVLFNDALNTFYLRLYSIGHMVKDHSESKRRNLLLPHRLLFSISSKGSFICIIPQTGYHIPQPLWNQSWCTGWNEKQLNGYGYIASDIW